MAKVKAPLMSEAAAGSIGGLMFRSGTYGPIVSRRSVAPSQRTEWQCDQRGRLKRAQTAWSSLTDDQRHSWSLVTSGTETPHNAFIRAATRAMTRNEDVPTSAVREIYSYTQLELQDLDPYFGAPQADLFWLYTGDSNLLANIYTYATYSRREYIKQHKMTLSTYCHANDEYAFVVCKCMAPIVWVRIDILTPNNYRLVGSAEKRYEVDWGTSDTAKHFHERRPEDTSVL